MQLEKLSPFVARMAIQEMIISDVCHKASTQLSGTRSQVAIQILA
jgi:hypothetical protein